VRLKLLQEVHALVRLVLHMHKDEIQARSKPSTAPHFMRGDKVLVVTTNLFLRGQPNGVPKGQTIGPFTLD
jgi:hypothetical protein